MPISRRVTNGLAWAGVLLVVGVPAADMISAKLLAGPGTERAAVMAQSAPLVQPASAPVVQSSTAPANVASAVPAVAPQPATRPTQTAAATADAVDSFVNSGRPLPSYITGSEMASAPAAAPSRPVTVIPSTTETASVPARQPAAPAPQAAAPAQTAAVPAAVAPTTFAQPQIDTASVAPPPKLAPVPAPLSLRPQPVAVAAAPQEVLIIPDTVTTGSIAPAPGAIVPPAGLPGANDRIVGTVSGEDLDEWESGPLSDFLARRQGSAQADYAVEAEEYDADGFFLDEGPDSSATFRQWPRREERNVIVYPLWGN